MADVNAEFRAPVRRVKNIGIAFTSKDEDVLDWVNLLIKYHQSPRTWIKAVLLADEEGLSLNAGTIIRSDQHSGAAPSTTSLYGFSPARDSQTGWERRGIPLGNSREFVVGSVMTITVRHKILIDLVDRLNEMHVAVSPYVKARLRKYFHVSGVGEEGPPDMNDALDIVFQATHLAGREGSRLDESADQ